MTGAAAFEQYRLDDDKEPGSDVHARIRLLAVMGLGAIGRRIAGRGEQRAVLVVERNTPFEAAGFEHRLPETLFDEVESGSQPIAHRHAERTIEEEMLDIWTCRKLLDDLATARERRVESVRALHGLNNVGGFEASRSRACDAYRVPTNNSRNSKYAAPASQGQRCASRARIDAVRFSCACQSSLGSIREFPDSIYRPDDRRFRLP